MFDSEKYLLDVARVASSDFQTTDDELRKVLDLVINDIASRTDVFKIRFEHKFEDDVYDIDFGCLTKRSYCNLDTDIC
jgi:hypothetical protein